MNVVFVAPHFPSYQKQFVRALKEVGANVYGIGEADFYDLPGEVQNWLDGYERVPSVTHD